MQFTTQQEQNAIRKLEELITSKPCSSCGSKVQFSIYPRFFELREFNNGNIILGGKDSAVIPLVVVTCPKCGDTRLYNAIMLGLLNQNKEKDGTEGK